MTKSLTAFDKRMTYVGVIVELCEKGFGEESFKLEIWNWFQRNARQLGGIKQCHNRVKNTLLTNRILDHKLSGSKLHRSITSNGFKYGSTVRSYNPSTPLIWFALLLPTKYGNLVSQVLCLLSYLAQPGHLISARWRIVQCRNIL